MTMTSSSVQARYSSSLKMDTTEGLMYPRRLNMDPRPLIESERARERSMEATEGGSKGHHYHGRKDIRRGGECVTAAARPLRPLRPLTFTVWSTKAWHARLSCSSTIPGERSVTTAGLDWEPLLRNRLILESAWSVVRSGTRHSNGHDGECRSRVINS